MKTIVECVPNFSEGRNQNIINAIAESVNTVKGVKLLGVEPDKDYNRTVVTFVGSPDVVLEAAFQATRTASMLIDMRLHKGEHPRLGATDVVPFVPVSGVTMNDCVQLAPDFGAGFNEKSGATVTGARKFLIAYNVNLKTADSKIAHEIALRIREAGRPKKDESGTTVKDEQGNAVKIPGSLKAVKAMGVFLERFNIAQVSINLVDYETTPPHMAFEEVRKEASTLGTEVTGSEIVGLAPLRALLMAGDYYSERIGSRTKDEQALVDLAVQSLGLSQLEPFDPARKIIEYTL